MKNNLIYSHVIILFISYIMHIQIFLQQMIYRRMIVNTPKHWQFKSKKTTLKLGVFDLFHKLLIIICISYLARNYKRNYNY